MTPTQTEYFVLNNPTGAAREIERLRARCDELDARLTDCIAKHGRLARGETADDKECQRCMGHVGNDMCPDCCGTGVVRASDSAKAAQPCICMNCGTPHHPAETVSGASK